MKVDRPGQFSLLRLFGWVTLFCVTLALIKLNMVIMKPASGEIAFLMIFIDMAYLNVFAVCCVGLAGPRCFH